MMTQERLTEAQIEEQKGHKLYIITHQELAPPYQLPQAVHAMAQFANDFFNEYRKWFSTSNTVVILAAKDEQSLHKLTQKLDMNGLKYSKFFEPDIGNALTSIAIVPSPYVKKYCSSLPLAGKVVAVNNK